MLTSCILLGVCAATFMRLSDGFKNVVPSVMIFVTYTISFVIFTATLPLWQLSIAYAIWSGAGTALTAVVGVQFFKEKLKPVNYWGFVLIIAGVRACLPLPHICRAALPRSRASWPLVPADSGQAQVCAMSA